ncbi:hypothetical protein HDK77DRAFT_479364 [Phyllosticta capitalensis]
MTSPTAEGDRPDKEYAKANPTKFRFKSKRSRRECDDEDDLDHHRSRRRRHSRDETEPSKHDEERNRRRHHHRHHRHHHRSRRHETPPPADTEPLMDEEPVSPNTAFRLSLFDAMADDEGALFWEGVYGQPIHTYPRPDGTSGSPSAEGTGGFLEAMTDEEYAEYVRTRMWEKTHQHIVEERERRERDRERRKEEERRRREDGSRKEREGEEFRRRVEESLRRGEARRAGKKWKAVWDAYLKRWDELAASKNDGPDNESRGPKDLLPWPVESGKMRHVERDEVERFWLNVPVPEGELMDTLKRERVRWHPDKIQQRFGGGAHSVDEPTMKAVTAIFQVLDRLWSEMRDKAKG